MPRSIDPYRENTLMIGSPTVFHTAPPHPTSNAFAHCTYVFVGGPDANQNGFGDFMPAKFTLRSAIVIPGHRDRATVTAPAHTRRVVPEASGRRLCVSPEKSRPRKRGAFAC